MTQYFARLDGSIVAEIIAIADNHDIKDLFPAALVATMVPANNTVHQGYLYDAGSKTFSAPPAPPPDFDAQLRDQLAQGIAITSTGTPALNGTYAIDSDTQQQISGVVALIGAGLGLPGGGSVLPWADIDGTPHNFTAASFGNFAIAVSTYVLGCRGTWNARKGGTPMAPWPAQPTSID